MSSLDFAWSMSGSDLDVTYKALRSDVGNRCKIIEKGLRVRIQAWLAKLDEEVRWDGGLQTRFCLQRPRNRRQYRHHGFHKRLTPYPAPTLLLFDPGKRKSLEKKSKFVCQAASRAVEGGACGGTV